MSDEVSDELETMETIDNLLERVEVLEARFIDLDCANGKHPRFEGTTVDSEEYCVNCKEIRSW